MDDIQKENLLLSHQRKMQNRQKWSDSPQLSVKLLARKNPNPQVNSDEILTIARFSKIPKCTFGDVKLGKNKLIFLMLNNPGVYAETLLLEEHQGEENGFDFVSIDSYPTSIVVEPEESKEFPILWTPKAIGSYRQIVNFKWQGGQKLQLILLGTASAPPKSKIKKVSNQQKAIVKPLPLMIDPTMDIGDENEECPTTPLRRTTFSIKKNSDAYAIPCIVDENIESSSIDVRLPLSELSLKNTNQSIFTTNNKINNEDKSNLSQVERKSTLIPTKKTRITEPRKTQNRIQKDKESIKSSNLTKKTLAKTRKAPKPVVGIPMKRLKLGLDNQSALPRHPMPYAAKNMYFDERWAEKQERGFKDWLNYIMTPCDSEDTSVKESQFNFSNEKQPVAPTKETLSFSVYSFRRKMSRLRQSACLLYQSEPITRVICKIEEQIENERIAVRLDKQIDADLGIKQKMLNILLSYNPLWLRIGLETVYGEVIMMQSNNDLAMLTRFIKERFLANPDISKTYQHSHVVGLHKKGYKNALAKFILKKFLLLVLFLDNAKLTRLIDHNPCLFVKTSKFKNSKDILLHFSREYLQSEGDLTKHLGYLGYSVCHVQTPLDEYDFGVENLAIDLRDGVRLIRMVEFLTQNWSLSSKVRLPAISRLQKIHNTNLALNGLVEHGMDIIAKEAKLFKACDLVDGHREKTLAFLWQVIFHFQLGISLDAKKLADEINYLQSVARLRNEKNNIVPRNDEEFLDFESHFKSEKLSLLMQWCQEICSVYGIKIHNFTVSFSDGRVFCYLIHHYHPGLVPIEAISHETTLTSSLAKEDEDSSHDEDHYTAWTKTFSPNTGINRHIERLLDNEKANYKVLNSAINFLGNVPGMIHHQDMSNTIPDEKVVITYVSYICARLLDIRKETRAARCIQLAWREKAIKILRVKTDAVVKLQAIARGFLTRHKLRCRSQAARIIQFHVREYLQRNLIQRRFFKASRQNVAARLIQKWWTSVLKMKQDRKDFMSMLRAVKLVQRTWREKNISKKNQILMEQKGIAAIVIQNCWRYFVSKRSKKQLESYERAAVVIQRKWIAVRICRQYRESFLMTRNSCIVLQLKWRATLQARNATKHYLKVKQAVTLLQQRWKATLIAKEQQMYFLSLKNSTLLIQRRLRATLLAKTQRKSFLLYRKSALTIQTHLRATHLAKNQCESFRLMKNSAILIQDLWRATMLTRKQRESFLLQRRSAILIQDRFRATLLAKKKRESFMLMRNSTIFIQDKWRATMLARKQRESFLLQRRSVILIQDRFRATLLAKNQRESFILMRNSTILIQDIWRATMLARKQRESFLLQRRSAILIQDRFRATLLAKNQRESFILMRNSTILIQDIWRATMLARKQRESFLLQRRSAILIQDRFRATLLAKNQRESFILMRNSTILIQDIWRATMLARKQRESFLLQRRSAILIQDRFRATLLAKNQRESFILMRNSTILIQDIWRATMLARKQRKSFLLQRRSAILIQDRFRATLLAKNQRESFILMRNSTILIQDIWRATMLARKQRESFLLQRRSAILIQDRFRATLLAKNQCESFILMRNSTIFIQDIWRATMLARKQRNSYLLQRRYAIVIQDIFRATLLAKNQRESFLMMKNSAVLIQDSWRVTMLARKQRESFLLKRSSAIVIQDRFRATLLASEQKGDFILLRQSTILIQKRLRETLLARKERQRFLAYLESALVIQQRWIATLFARQERQQFLSYCNAAAAIQRRWRSYISSRSELASFKEHKSACVTIQRRWRATLLGCKQRKMFLTYRRAVVCIQKRLRVALLAKRERQVYLAYRKSAICIQTHYRRMVLCRNERNTFCNMRNSSIIIQEKWRATMFARMQKKCFISMCNAAICIQRWWRSILLSKKFSGVYIDKPNLAVNIHSGYENHVVPETTRQLQAASIIQLHWRSHCNMKKTRNIYLQRNYSAIVIQRFWREYLQQKKDFRVYQIIQGACIAIQAVVRGHLSRKHLKQQHKAATVIQSVFKMYIMRRDYNAKQVDCNVTFPTAANESYDAALIIQRHWRVFVMRQRFMKMKKACLCIQQNWRLYKLKQNMVVQFDQSVVGIGKTFELSLLSDIFEEGESQLMETNVENNNADFNLNETIVLCRHTEDSSDVTLFDQRRESSAQLIQSYFRAYLIRKNLIVINNAAVRIQSTYRGYVRRQQYIKLKASVIVLQGIYRSFNEKRFARKQSRKVNQAAIIIQSAWRGYLVRKATKSKKIKAVRKRIEIANSNATEAMKLCNRNRSALDYLLSCKNISTIYDKLVQIEIATRLSEKCCQTFVEDNALAVIYKIVGNCNRSLPSINLIEISLLVLRNLVEYQSTYMAVYLLPNFVSFLVDLMSNFRERKSMIFYIAGMLIARLCQQSNDIIEEILHEEKTILKIRKLHFLVHRKASSAYPKSKGNLPSTSSKGNIRKANNTKVQPDRSRSDDYISNAVTVMDLLVNVITYKSQTEEKDDVFE